MGETDSWKKPKAENLESETKAPVLQRKNTHCVNVLYKFCIHTVETDEVEHLLPVSKVVFNWAEANYHFSPYINNILQTG